ncbi:Tyrosine recombinase XerD [Aquicella siphonis]|uniref:Tyrosine recombinase XerD n=1 Tax=Aquicella siphonis TaxID=254247 RepID=A0A5E4PJW7_9COXI|nr:site-specific integrase [Aquicella siphonis]VVC76768.1 Tyrosine recombinase XerD [Aquicella siphonis]
MGRAVKDSRIDTRDARLKQKISKEPYWRLISKGIHIGYYKGSKKAGMWHARVRTPDGKRYKKEVLGKADDYHEADGKTVLTFAQAQILAHKFAEKIFKHDDLHITIKNYTVKMAIDDYLKDFKAHGKKSLYSTDKQIEAHILPAFGDRLVSSLTYRQLDQWKNKLATSDKRSRTGKCQEQKYTPYDNNDPEYSRKRRATANRIITIFKAILNHAYKTEQAESNDAWIKLKPFKNVSAAKIRFLNTDEANRLLNACTSDFRLLVRGALLTGARYGELVSLKVSDYNLESNIIHIHQSKSGKPRHIPLNQEGINFFTQITTGRNNEEFLFTRNDSHKWGKSHQARPMLEACRIAKITPSISFHELRHTYASALAMKGVPLQVIAAVLGHTDTRITHKHYAHLMPSYIADVIRQHLPNFGSTEKTNVRKIKQKVVNE